MSARFRIRTPTGQELSFASLDVFREFVRSGDLSPDDVVYDAETREWSSARTHPVVLEIEMEAEEAAEAPESTSVPDADAASQSVEDASTPAFAMDIGLDLAPAPSQLSPEEEAAAFVAKMEAERAADLTLTEGSDSVLGFTMEPSGPAVAEPVVEATPPPTRPAPQPAPFYDEPVRREEPRRHEAPLRYEEPKRKRTRSAAWKYAPFVILVAAVGAGGLYFGPELFLPPASDESDASTTPVVPPPAPVIPATEEALRARARERFLSSTQALLRSLQPIPEAWLGGQYLAEPSDFAYVRDVWQTYLETVREVRAADTERYRAAYSRALDDAGVQEPARSTRLQRGMAEFDSRAAARNRHYDRVETLATVAMSGHDELVAAEGRILYEPAAGRRVSNDPVIEAVGRTPADQALLEEVLDAILAELQGEGGAGTAPNVREWVYTGLLDAVTN
jgi:hypothetical protein